MTSVLKQRFESSVNDGCRNFGTTVHEFVTVEDVRNVFQSMQSREEFDAFLLEISTTTEKLDMISNASVLSVLRSITGTAPLFLRPPAAVIPSSILGKRAAKGNTLKQASLSFNSAAQLVAAVAGGRKETS